MKIVTALEAMDPRRAYGKMSWSDTAHTILANDYKAPPLWLIVYEEDSDEHR